MALMFTQLLQALDGSTAPRGELTPSIAAEIVAGLAPSARRKLRTCVGQALRHHQAEGRSVEARFCVVMLNALVSAA